MCVRFINKAAAGALQSGKAAVLINSLFEKFEDPAKRSPRMAVLNNYFTLVFFSLSAIIGSLSALFLAVATIWAVVRVSLGHLQLSDNRPLRIVALAFLLYPVTELISVVVNQRGLEGVLALGGAALSLSILPVSSRLMVSSPQNIAASAAKSAAAAGVVLACYSLIELFIRNADRPEAGLGNPNVMAAFSLFVCCLCLSLVTIIDPRLRKWVYFGAFCAFNAMMFSGTRAVWLTAPFALLFAALPLRGEIIRPMSVRKVVLVGVTAISFLAVGVSIVFDRMQATIASFQQSGVLTTDLSIATRFMLWRGGLEQFKTSWLFGYGPDSTNEMIGLLGGDAPMTFTHYHNFLLTGAIRGGILEVIALVSIVAALAWFALQSSTTPIQKAGRAVVMSIAVAGFMPAMSGVLFTHDISNAVFLYSIIIGLSLAVSTATDSAPPSVGIKTAPAL
jgi:O-antigen ligase